MNQFFILSIQNDSILLNPKNHDLIWIELHDTYPKTFSKSVPLIARIKCLENCASVLTKSTSMLLKWNEIRKKSLLEQNRNKFMDIAHYSQGIGVFTETISNMENRFETTESGFDCLWTEQFTADEQISLHSFCCSL